MNLQKRFFKLPNDISEEFAQKYRVGIQKKFQKSSKTYWKNKNSNIENWLKLKDFNEHLVHN